MRIQSALFFLTLAFLVSCGQPTNKSKLGGDSTCKGTGSCTEQQKVLLSSLMYKLTCSGANSRAAFFSGTSTFTLENNTYASLDLLLLPNGEYELFYSETNGTYSGTRYLQSADATLRRWQISEDAKTIYLIDAQESDANKNVIALSQVSKSGDKVSLVVVFKKQPGESGSHGITKSAIILNYGEKPYGRGMKRVADLCKN